MSKQHKIVSFLYLLGSRRLPAPEATALFVFSGYGGVCTGRAAQYPPQECPFWMAFETLTQLGKSIRLCEMESSLLLGARMWAEGTLRAA